MITTTPPKCAFGNNLYPGSVVYKDTGLFVVVNTNRDRNTVRIIRLSVDTPTANVGRGIEVKSSEVIATGDFNVKLINDEYIVTNK